MKYVIQDNGGGNVYRMESVPVFEGVDPLTQQELVEGLYEHFDGVPGMKFEVTELPLGSSDMTNVEPSVHLTFDDWETPAHIDVLSMELAIMSLALRVRPAGSQ